MKKVWISALVLVLGSAVLGATVLQEPLAQAAAPIASVLVTNDESSPVPVREQNLDADGNIKVHEQGTANVSIQGVPSVKFSEEPFSQMVLLQFQAAGDGTASQVINVPAGKLFTIRYISARDNFDATLTELRLGREVILGTANLPVFDRAGDLELVSEEVLFYAGGGVFGPRVTGVRDALPTTTELVQVLLVGTLSDA